MITEEIEVFEVQLCDRVSNEVLETFDAGPDYDKAVQQKDEWDLEYNDGTMYTKIEIFTEDVE